MEILVVGRGWTGNKVLQELRMRGHAIKICSHAEAFKRVKEHKWDWVVNCAGLTGTPNVDACENDKMGTLKANALFPIELYNTCNKNNIRFAHFSSGCIYQGTITDIYAEPNYFGSIYSVSKGISDVYLKDKAVVFRIRMPFTNKNEAKNYLFKVLNYAKTAKLIDAGINSLSNLDEAVSVASDIIEENKPIGPYNLVNKGSVNMHELAEIMGIRPQWFTPEEFANATKAGRSTCTIPAYYEMSDLRSTLTQCIENMKMAK